jgi:glycosyltransferase involved in cell wall biosynthesis
MNAWGSEFRHLVVSVGVGELGARAGLRDNVIVDFPAFPDLKSGTLLQRLSAIHARIQDLKPDLILTYNWGAMEVVLANRLFRMAPLVHHEDGFGPDEAVKQLPRRMWFRRFALGGASSVIVPSLMLERAALEVWWQRRSRVVRISNGVDVKLFDSPPSPFALPGLDRSDGVLQVGTVAGLRPEKNLRRLVRVFARATEGLKARLVIVGEGPEREAVLEEARKEGVADRVHLTGFLPDPYRYMGLFDVFALTSDTEQFPISLVEAMAAKLPAVCTRVGDIADILPPENQSFVHEPVEEAVLANSLKQLFGDARLRNSVGTANRKTVERNYSLQTLTKSYRAIYGGACGGAANSVTG